MTPSTTSTVSTAIARFWSLAAPLYDQRCLQRWVYRPAQDEVIAQLRRHGSRQIADIACGTGILTDRIQRELLPEEVYGIDMADGMLAQARKRSDRVRWMCAPAEKLPFADGFLDAVVTTSAFHFFDQPAALREFRRVLGPGGVVVATTISPGGRTVRALFTDAGFTIADQHRVRRPVWAPVSDVVTVGIRP